MRIFISVVIILSAFISAAVDDSTPLFQLGQQKWEPDSYRGIVVFSGEHPADKEKGLNFIEGRIQDKARALNLVVGRADINDKSIIDEKTNGILKTFKPDRLPFTVIYFPAISDVEIPLWAGYLTATVAESICDSPARREIARRLIKGDNAVWLLVVSGNDEADANAYQMLSGELRQASGVIPEPMPVNADPEMVPDEKIIVPAVNPMKMSIIRISKDDKSEIILLEMLNCMEPEIMNAKNDPVIVPIYGKGRILDIFSSDEVNKENVRTALRKLSSPCTEGIKEPASGSDMLMSVNWNAFLKGGLSVDKDLPALKSFGDGAEKELVDMLPPEYDNVSLPDLGPGSPAAEDAASPPPPVQMKIINLFLALIIAFLSLLFVVVVMKLRR
ncbi:MAG TPA: hypothetical protein DET40_02940 [Lentisphaeria bacterium]|nr:MAG: hypothetical protein A2X45_14125 [Lentisphaerae bacterium GWF2_50_93]HCE42486.1 hypothetical protein [Lentisphaeria bacterium]